MPIENSDISFYELTGHYVNNTSALKLFNLLKDTDTNTYFLNLFRNYTVNSDAETKMVYYMTHEVDSSDLWWVIALFNGILNPFEELDQKQFLKILKPQFIYQLCSELDLIGSL
jgi:hypothetical protein